MSVSFRMEISWSANPLLLPAELFGVTVPAGLGSFYVRAPNFVDVPQMSALLRSGSNLSPSASLGSVNGLVTKNLIAALASPSQLAPVRTPGAAAPTAGPLDFRFQGGEIVITLDLGIHMMTTVSWEPVSDDLQTQIFAEVYSHELLHVLDETTLLTGWLPTNLLTDPWIAQYLVRAETFRYGRASTSPAQTEANFRTYFMDSLHTAIWNVWGNEANRRTAIRDAPAEYRQVEARVGTLRAAQINRH